MNILNKIKSVFVVDYDEYDDEYYDPYDTEEVEKDLGKATSRFKRDDVRNDSSATSNRTSSRPSIGFRQSKVVPMKNDMEVCVIKPTYFENAHEIIDELLANKAVVLNLEGIKIDLAQRIIDLVSGGCYAIRGNLQKISGYIYLVTPRNVDITGDYQDLLGGDNVSISNTFGRNF